MQEALTLFRAEHRLTRARKGSLPPSLAVPGSTCQDVAPNGALKGFHWLLPYFCEPSHQADNIAPVWEPHTKCPDKMMASSKIHKHTQKKESHEIKDNKQQREAHTQNLLVFMSHLGLPVSSYKLWECTVVHPLLENHRGAIFLGAQRQGRGETLHK